MNISVNPFRFQSTIFERRKKDRELHATQCPVAGFNNIQSSKIAQLCITITDDIPLKPKQSMSTNVVQSSPLLDMRTDIHSKKIISKVRLARGNIIKLFRTSNRVSPHVSNLRAFAVSGVHQHWDVHASPLLTPTSQSAIPRVHTAMAFDSLPLGKTRLDTIASLATYSEYDHGEDFVFILRSVAEVPPPSSSVHLFTAPYRKPTPPSTALLNKLHINEEQVGNPKADAEVVHMKSNKLSMTSSCVSLRTSTSEAKYDAMLATEFATFYFDSDDSLEWTDEVEREKQARMDAHFAYVSEALAVPVPKLSACFAADSPTDFTNVDEEGFISDPSPLKTETSETNTSSADSSLVTSIDAKESRTSSTTVRGLRRVKNHGDLRNMHLITDSSDSCSDISCWSLELGLSDLTTARTKTGMLRRSVRCNDLRKSFSSLEPEKYPSSRHETRASN